MATPEKPSRPRVAPRVLAALVGLGALAASAPAAASAAAFVPRGSSARVERHHVAVALTASGTITWSTIDLSGAADVGVIVAVKAGGRVELAGRTWIDVVEEATRVVVTAIPADKCKPIAVTGNVSLDAGLAISGDGTGGCNGGGSAQGDGKGGGGCWSNSSGEGSGCSPTPSDEGHPGCSAFNTTTGCSPVDPGGSSPLDASPGPPRVGPYDVVRVRAGDGSALAWLDAAGFDPGVSFAASASALEADGYELYAVRARAPAPSSIVQSLRVITTSPSPSFPLRLVRMGAGGRGSVTPLTLVTLGPSPQRIVDLTPLKVDVSRLAWAGTSSNYESLVASLLGQPAPVADAGAPVDSGAGDGGGLDGGSLDAGAPIDAGPGETRWLLELARSVENRRAGASTAPDGSLAASATLADRFGSVCKLEKEIHAVCSAGGDASAPPGDGGSEGGVADGGGPDGGEPDAGDAGSPDGGPKDAGAAGCADRDRQRCDDLGLAIPAGGAATATRFRAVISGDPAVIKDLTFAASSEAIPDGRYTVRVDGQAGLCEPVDIEASASAEGEATCGQARPRRRGLDWGPLVTVAATIASVGMILRRARRRR